MIMIIITITMAIIMIVMQLVLITILLLLLMKKVITMHDNNKNYAKMIVNIIVNHVVIAISMFTIA